MKKKYLIVVDMQNDFITGSIESKLGQAIIPNVVKKVKEFEGTILVTKDTHTKDYMKTQEGRYLPIEHCIKGTKGWEIIPELVELLKDKKVFEKPTFGSTELVSYFQEESKKYEIESIELIGVCTDICVVSNALLLKAYFPETPLFVDSSCCAGSNADFHESTIKVLRSCQVIVY